MNQKPPMNLSDHIRLASRLHIADTALRNGLVDILQYHVPKQSKEYRKICAAIKATSELISMMDDIVCSDEPDGIGYACTDVYYGIEDAYPNTELELMFNRYAHRHAAYLVSLDKADAEEIVITDYDSVLSKFFDCNEVGA